MKRTTRSNSRPDRSASLRRMELHSEIAPIRFGSSCSRVSGDGSWLELALPVLAGNPISPLPFESGAFSRSGDWSTWRSADLLCAFGTIPVSGALSDAAHRLYQQAFELAGDRHLLRFWNFIPGINLQTAGLENYRSFGVGRHQAFVERFGRDDAHHRMPAATGVGIDDPVLAVVLVAGTTKPEHLENPNQVPAYNYPTEYGPRPPAFARATRVVSGGLRLCFLAGTSSVLGHASVGVGDLPRQIEITLDNIETMGARLGLGPALGRGQGLKRMFRIYLRRSSDLELARATVEGRLLDPADSAVWLQSDICRADLGIEIDATVVG